MDWLKQTLVNATAGVALLGAVETAESTLLEKTEEPVYRQQRETDDDSTRIAYAELLQEELSDDQLIERKAQSVPFNYDESLTEQDVRSVSWGFLLAVETVHDRMSYSNATREYIGETVAADLAHGEQTFSGRTADGDNGSLTVPADSTELGGAVVLDRKRLLKDARMAGDISDDGLIHTDTDIAFVLYEPEALHGNGAYDPPAALSEAEGFPFHYHAESVWRSPYMAGPSGMNAIDGYGDIGSALYGESPQIVITYAGISTDGTVTVNCDVYSETGEVVDAGTYDTGVTLPIEAEHVSPIVEQGSGETDSGTDDAIHEN